MHARDVFLGIDLGTSNLKAVLVDVEQTVLAAASVPLRTAHTFADWAEQAPEDWWAALLAAIDALRDANEAAWQRVKAIGLSGQMHGCVLLDTERRVLRPAILWNDARATAQSDALRATGAIDAAVAGATMASAFYPPKLQWLRTHEAPLFARIAYALPPKDFLRMRMTGMLQTDACDAAATLCCDSGGARWHAESLALCGLTAAQMPEIVFGSDAAGTLLPEIADAWGLGGAQAIAVAGGSGDSAAGAVGVGAIGHGDMYLSLGTSAQVFRASREYEAPAAGGVQSFPHALPGRFFQAAAIVNGGSSLAWAAQFLQYGDVGEMLADAAQSYVGPCGVLVLPYLAGERAPHDDPHARGVIFGCTQTTTRRDIAQAVLEGLACSIAGAREQLPAGGATEIGIIGGSARDRFVVQMLANVMDMDLLCYAGTEHGPAFGAARLARLAWSREAPEAVCTAPAIRERIVPDMQLHAAYRELRARRDALYAALRPEFTRSS